jgi:hypothetical protein
MAEVVSAQKRKWLDSHVWLPHVRKGERTPECARLIKGERRELEYAALFMSRHERVEKPNSSYLQETKNCSRFIQDRGYIMSASEEERAFPLAFR